MRLLRLAILLFIGLASAQAKEPGIIRDAERKLITISDDQTNLVLCLNYNGCCFLSQVKARGREIIATGSAATGSAAIPGGENIATPIAPGVNSAIKVNGQWFSTHSGIPTPKVSVAKNTVTVEDILFGGNGIQVRETWRFTAQSDRILWQIDRCYLSGGAVEDTCFPVWNFKDMSTWTGGLLGNGGVIWNKYLETPNATFGTRADSVTFWSRSKHDCLRISANAPADCQIAAKFSHQPDNAFSFASIISQNDLQPKHTLRRFLRDRQDVWKPFDVSPGKTTVHLALQALDYDKEYCLGTTKGLNEESIREVLHTIARYGVIDRGLVGGNGWRTGWVCLHEQWFAQFGLALADPGYTRTFADALDYERDHAILPDGRVKSRWHHTPDDAEPGTFDALGFYEAQWGTLLDSQPDYVINVAEQFDLTGDLPWLRGQKSACERALDYLLLRDSDGDGLVEMMTDSHSQHKGSDWIDIIWASHENALVNAEFYYALQLWADAEDTLGDKAHAGAYRQSAEKLKASFNRTTAEGGFWDPKNQWYVYWRDKDDSIHGNNLVTAVNFAAIGYGLCEDASRQKAILDRMESEMQKEKLFFWPLSFFPYEPGEGHPNNYPFPKYENGDIFLSWGELGIRSYAKIDPALAVKYIKKVLARYETDGLSFQRYLRQSQHGSGDDILAGNCSAVVGLYRDIYGIQPQHDRLWLEPRLTPELDGTQLRYLLRAQQYQIDLRTNDCRVSVGAFAVRSASPFGLNAKGRELKFFPARNAFCEMSLTPGGTDSLELRVETWSGEAFQPRRWTESSPSKTKVRHFISNLQPGAAYQLIIQNEPAHLLRASQAGCVEFSSRIPAAAEQKFELQRK